MRKLTYTVSTPNFPKQQFSPSGPSSFEASPLWNAHLAVDAGLRHWCIL